MNFSNLATKISPYVQGLGYPVILDAIRESARDFCEDTEIWRDLKLDIDIAPKQAYIDISFGKDINVIQIRKVMINGFEIRQLTNEEYLSQGNVFDDSLNSGTPRACAFFAPSRIQFLPINGEETKLNVFCSLKPSLEAETMPEDILSDYGDVIKHGALRELYLMPNKPWFSYDLSKYHDRKFVLGCQKAKASANKGNSNRHLVVNLRNLTE